MAEASLPMTSGRIWVERLIGVWLLVLALLLVLGWTAQSWPDEIPAIGILGRMADSLRVHILILAIVLALPLAALGLRGGALLCAFLAVAGLVNIAVDMRQRVAPAGTDDDLTLVWMNLLHSNPVAPETLATALRGSGADLIVLAEAAAARPVVEALADIYPHRLGCTGETRDCNLMILSRLPQEQVALRNLRSGPERMARFVIERPGKAPVAILALHLLKPWYIGINAPDIWSVNWRLENDPVRPALVIGDFNAALWSGRLRQIERQHGLRHAPWPVATWPSAAGALGIPIDHVLLRDGLGLTSLEAWGEGLGSNHRGLRIRIDLPDATAEGARTLLPCSETAIDAPRAVRPDPERPPSKCHVS
ncbi:endonuclease/exonuclease/phosphatase family protein [Salipiger thiooxidans]|uniref:endonuclease/exonuclease/phosphatase family protein n=1 Tax=Salipiger thiooxidans TaxID=282683 RepID=UPI001CF96647|nr:endonuclease/exonuclease/phosphatase family protein [Salipiger thiooxidans]